MYGEVGTEVVWGSRRAGWMRRGWGRVGVMWHQDEPIAQALGLSEAKIVLET